jgi:hypothetical protein
MLVPSAACSNGLNALTSTVMAGAHVRAAVAFVTRGVWRNCLVFSPALAASN